MNYFLKLLTPLLMIALMSGCGDPKVTGKVTFPDGTPLTKGQVMFQSDGFIGSGDIRENGTYSAGKLKDGDGLPLGTYQVFIGGATTLGELKNAPQEANIGSIQKVEMAKSINLVDYKYMSPSTSGLTVKVEGKTKFDFTVEPPK